MKKLVFLFLLFLLLPVTISAQKNEATSSADTVVYVGEDTVYTGNLLKVGESVTILGIVQGDVLVAGGDVRIKGKVEGDVIAVGGNISFSGEAEDLILIGGNVVIDGTAKRNIRVLAGSLTMSGTVERNALVGTGVLTTEEASRIQGTLTAGAGTVVLDGTIEGHVELGAETVTLLPNSHTEGNFTYLSENPFDKKEGAVISGVTTHTVPAVPVPERKRFAGIFEYTSLAFFLFTLFSKLIVGAILVSFAPRQSIAIVNLMIEKPIKSLFVGMGSIVLTPLLLVITFATLIGIPLSLIGGVLFLIILYAAPVFFGLLLGIKIIQMHNREYDTSKLILPLTVGLTVYTALTNLIFVGWAIHLLALFLSFGALVLLSREALTRLSGRI
ncbi:MAG TPA: polymer-forming cytoskeletal protein [Patescibacteria group bacterium]|nr:polymer-forming cytoskeletal protein [Patescibacteria group bacterium]